MARREDLRQAMILGGSIGIVKEQKVLSIHLTLTPRYATYATILNDPLPPVNIIFYGFFLLCASRPFVSVEHDLAP
jgi:hypothetical protein